MQRFGAKLIQGGPLKLFVNSLSPCTSGISFANAETTVNRATGEFNKRKTRYIND